MANDPKYTVGDTAPGGNKVKQIYGQSDTVFVFKSEQDSVSYFIDAAEPTPLQTASLREFDDVHGLMVRVYPKADWPTVQDELGSALYNALTASTEDLMLAAQVQHRGVTFPALKWQEVLIGRGLGHSEVGAVKISCSGTSAA